MEWWVEEQGGLLDSDEVGRTEEVTEALLRRLDTLDLENQRGRLERLLEAGDPLVLLRHPSSPLVSESLSQVQEHYEVLVRRSALRRGMLEQQLSLHVFEREAKELQTWLTSKKALAESQDCGQDLEAVEVLEKRLDLLESEVSLLGPNRFSSVLQLAHHLEDLKGVGPAREDLKGLGRSQQKEAELTALWDDLNKAIKTREQALQEAREVHQLSVDVEELKSRLGEKETVLEAEEPSHDLLSLQTLLRQQDALEREVELLGEEVSSTREESRALAERLPRNRAPLLGRLEEVEGLWRRLQDKTSRRRVRLTQAHSAHRYLSQWEHLMAWLKEMMSLVRGEGLRGAGADLEQLIRKHEEYRVQIDRQLSQSQALKDEGRGLLEQGNFMSEEVEERGRELEEVQAELLLLWEETREEQEEVMELLLLQREVEQADRWLTSYQHTLTSEEYGDSVSDVAELLKNQEDLEVGDHAPSQVGDHAPTPLPGRRPHPSQVGDHTPSQVGDHAPSQLGDHTPSQSKRRLGNHGNRDEGGAERKPPVRVSSLKRRTSDLRTPRVTSTSYSSRGGSSTSSFRSNKQTDRADRQTDRADRQTDRADRQTNRADRQVKSFSGLNTSLAPGGASRSREVRGLQWEIEEDEGERSEEKFSRRSPLPSSRTSSYAPPPRNPPPYPPSSNAPPPRNPPPSPPSSYPAPPRSLSRSSTSSYSAPPCSPPPSLAFSRTSSYPPRSPSSLTFNILLPRSSSLPSSLTSYLLPHLFWSAPSED
ncbi:Spectrin beta chain, non-erythrocytic 5 [Merluccius polli]|uniref:Spectrin beta chain, non-erythrocytic 5 n=1 Tax=Merluccius polli TaxID=89951 RepID=A0AA47P486_MERPO|nr:Spectrin beta chain, non-erythrocytic 5 [Merluccius polli]